MPAGVSWLTTRLLAALAALAAVASMAACGDDDRAPVSPVPPGRDTGTGGGRDFGVPGDDDMGVPDDDMGAPDEDLGSPELDMGTEEDTSVPPPPPFDLGPPPDLGPPERDAFVGTDAAIGPLTRAILFHSCDVFDGRPTLVLELSGSAPATCDPSMDETLALTVRANLPVEAPETFEGESIISGALCVPDGGSGLTCMSGSATLTFDTYEDDVVGSGTYSVTVNTTTYAGDFAATFCPRVDVCGG